MKVIKAKNRSNQFRRSLRAAAALLLSLFLVCGAAQTTNAQGGGGSARKPSAAGRGGDCAFPAAKGPVSDHAKFISRPVVRELEGRLLRLKEKFAVELAVVIVPTTGGEDVGQYSLRLARCREIGRREGGRGGVLLFIAKNDRTWRIQVSRSLEGVLTDGTAKEIGDRMGEDFKSNNYDLGVKRAVNELIEKLEKRRN